MDANEELRFEFQKRGGLMRTSELKSLGYHSRKIVKLLENGILSKVKIGVYELASEIVPDEVMLMKLFPTAVIYLESALLHYNYTNRIPATWQLAVDKNISKQQFKISYPPVTPFYLDSKYLHIGLTKYEMNGVKIRIYDKERTMCDVLRYANKLEREIFNTAIQSYIKDKEKKIVTLMDYAKKIGGNSKGKILFWGVAVMEDAGASVIARLKARAAKDGLQLQLLLNLFCQEEFLRRMQKSRYCDNLILKGGFLLYAISGYASRPTMDADYLLKNRSNEMAEVEKMVDIIQTPNDTTFLRHGDRKAEPTLCKVQNCVQDLHKIIDFAMERSNEISLFACSMGAYFALKI